MKYLDWDNTKNEKLQKERNISFEEIVVAIEEGRVIDIADHPNKKKFPNQQIFIIELFDYIYLVPFVEDEHKVFLKTIFPSRKYTQIYLGQEEK